MQAETTRHLRVELECGAVITLPVDAFLDQALVRRMAEAAIGRELESPPMSEEDWVHWVFETAEAAETEA